MSPLPKLWASAVAAAMLCASGADAHPPGADGGHGDNRPRALPSTANIRTWTNARTGEVVRGAFLAARTVDAAGGGVRVSIERDTGDVITFPLADLAETDRAEAQRRIEEVRATNGRLAAADAPQPAAPATSAPSDAAAKQPAPPAQAAPFNAFAPFVSTRWDSRWLYVESDGLPHVPGAMAGGKPGAFAFSHPMMVGITAWQQQVPLPQTYRGSNAWQIPLKPELAEKPVSAREQLFRGAIALAANGVPIFNPIKNDGRTDTFLAGELDEFGGHCGRADDYHYHIAPTHLQKYVGAGRPIAYALDGFAIYGLFDPAAAPGGPNADRCCPLGSNERLDWMNGHHAPAPNGSPPGAKGSYHYHASASYPYLNGGMRGVVTVKEDQIDPQPRAESPRAALPPLRGAKITGFRASGKDDEPAWSLQYTLSGKTHFVNYRLQNGTWIFDFVDPSGATRTDTYDAATPQRRQGGGGGGRRGDGENGRRPQRDDAPPRDPVAPPAAERNAGAPAAAPSVPWVTNAIAAPRVSFHTFDSSAAKAKVSYHLYTPAAYADAANSTRRFPVVYWLHGSGGGLAGIPQVARHFDAAIAAGKTPPCLVVFVNGLAEGMYVDWKDGTVPLETVIVNELVPHIDATHRTLATREGRLLDGFSMGGYGAARLGFKFPEMFRAVSIVGAGPMQAELIQAPRAGRQRASEVLAKVYGGDQAYFRGVSPRTLAVRNAATIAASSLVRVVIGEQDETFDNNRLFHEHLEALRIPHGWTVLPGIAHDPMGVLRALGDDNWAFYRAAFADPPVPAPPAEAAKPAASDKPDFKPRTTVTRTVKVGVLERRALIYTPRGYDAARPMPVVVAFHGGGGSPEAMINFSGLNDKADEAGFIAVYPYGTGRLPDRLLTFNAGNCCGYAVENGIDDVGFTRALLDDLAREINIDENRVFATGMSNGGIMAYRVASELADRFAAIAPVGGPMGAQTCNPSRPVAVMHFHGTDDASAPFNGGQGVGHPLTRDRPVFLSVQHSLDQWIKANACAQPPEVVNLPDAAADGTSVTRTTWGGGKDGTEVVLITINGGGHTWPGREPPLRMLGASTRDVSANDLMWEFFQRHARKPAAGRRRADPPTRPALSSVDVVNGRLSIDCTCDSKSTPRAPALAWSEPPEGTRAFAIVMHHVARDGDTHVYMVVANIPAAARELKSGDLGTGRWGQNTVNRANAYAPPCSQGPGDKSYTITLYALAEEAKVSPGTPAAALTRDALLAAIKDTTLATATLEVTYARANAAGDQRRPDGKAPRTDR